MSVPHDSRIEATTQSPGRARSLQDQMTSTADLLRKLRAQPSTPNTNGRAISRSNSIKSSRAPERDYSEQDLYQPQERTRSFASSNGDSVLHSPRARFVNHRLSVTSFHESMNEGILTYQTDAEKQLMDTINAAKQELDADMLLVLLERVAVSAISLYNSSSSTQAVDTVCISLTDFIRQYTQQRRPVSPPTHNGSSSHSSHKRYHRRTSDPKNLDKALPATVPHKALPVHSPLPSFAEDELPMPRAPAINQRRSMSALGVQNGTSTPPRRSESRMRVQDVIERLKNGRR